jgi:Flp pilus assembly protein CpaB
MRTPPLLDRLDGPPLSLPRFLDALSERYWHLGPRRRAVVGAAVLVAPAVLWSVAAGGSEWGDPVDVVVATRQLPAGHDLVAGDLAMTRRPEALVPDGAAATAAEGTLVGVLPKGAVLTEAHLGDGGHGALVAAGRVAVAFPLDLLPEHTVGAVLDLVGTDGQGGARTLATAARVLAADEHHLWVEVDRADAAVVAAAARDGSAAAVVHPP